MLMYHSTSREAASQILEAGFEDRLYFGIASGVFFSDRPLDAGDGVAAAADAVIVIECKLSADQLKELEVIVEDRPPEAYREWLIPAALVNQMPRQLWSDPELE